MAYKPLILIACQIKLLLAGSTPSGCYLPPAARRPKAIFRDALKLFCNGGREYLFPVFFIFKIYREFLKGKC